MSIHSFFLVKWLEPTAAAAAAAAGFDQRAQIF
jgi:hypothetical protein